MRSDTSPDPTTRPRVLLAEMPTLLSDVLQHAIERSSDLDVCVDVADDLSAALDKYDPQVAVIGIRKVDERDTTDRGFRLLYEHPRLRVLLLRVEGNECRAYELRPTEARLGDLGPDELVSAVQAGATEAVWQFGGPLDATPMTTIGTRPIADPGDDPEASDSGDDS